MLFIIPQLKTIRHLLTLILLGVTLTTGCEEAPPEYKAFFELPPDQQKAEAEKFPVAKQIDYYLAEKRYVHGASSGLHLAISKQGKSAIPALLERMKREEQDYQKVNLLGIFRTMHRFYYSLSGEKEVIEQLRQVVSGIKDAERKKSAEELLTDIIEDRPPRKYGETP